MGAETSQQGQIEYLNNRCIVLPFKKYQVLDKPGRNVIANVNTNKLHDCVAFEVDLYKWWKAHKKQGKKYSEMEAEKPEGDKKQEEKYEESSDTEAEKPEGDKKQEKKYEDYSDTEAEEPEGNKKEEKQYEEYSEMEAEKPEEKKYEYQ